MMIVTGDGSVAGGAARRGEYAGSGDGRTRKGNSTILYLNAQGEMK